MKICKRNKVLTERGFVNASQLHTCKYIVDKQGNKNKFNIVDEELSPITYISNNRSKKAFVLDEYLETHKVKLFNVFKGEYKATFNPFILGFTCLLNCFEYKNKVYCEINSETYSSLPKKFKDECRKKEKFEDLTVKTDITYNLGRALLYNNKLKNYVLSSRVNFIPQEILFNNENTRIIFIKGLLTNLPYKKDGNKLIVNYGNFTFLKHLGLLIQSLGGDYKWSSKNNYYEFVFYLSDYLLKNLFNVRDLFKVDLNNNIEKMYNGFEKSLILDTSAISYVIDNFITIEV